MEEETPLFELIYSVVRQIPRGKVATYGQISRIVGRCSAQMIGFALAALKSFRDQDASGDVPWQRVINSKGRISPHGVGLGSLVQRQLLEEEGIIFDSEGVVDLATFSWDGILTTPIRNRQNLL